MLRRIKKRYEAALNVLPTIGLRPAAALRDVLKEGYDRKKLKDDVLAGIVVGIVALPLSMALAIASGVTPDPAAGTPRGYQLWPLFTTPFEWNGQNNLVFDASVQAGTTCQILRAGFVAFGTPFPARRAIGTNYTASSADYVVETSVYDIRFNKRRRTTKATSLWYELSSDNPSFAAPIISPVGQPGGVTVLVELEGAPGKTDPLNPSKFIPNTTAATGFTTDITQIDGHRFFRFRVTMIANLNSNQSARLTSVQFPYQF